MTWWSWLVLGRQSSAHQILPTVFHLLRLAALPIGVLRGEGVLALFTDACQGEYVPDAAEGVAGTKVGGVLSHNRGSLPLIADQPRHISSVRVYALLFHVFSSSV